MKTKNTINEQPQGLFIVTSIKKRNGQDSKFSTIGTYTTLAEAQTAAQKRFEENIETSNIDHNEIGRWTRTETDPNGSFRFGLDKYNYYEYVISSSGSACQSRAQRWERIKPLERAEDGCVSCAGMLPVDLVFDKELYDNKYLFEGLLFSKKGYEHTVNGQTFSYHLFVEAESYNDEELKRTRIDYSAGLVVDFESLDEDVQRELREYFDNENDETLDLYECHRGGYCVTLWERCDHNIDDFDKAITVACHAIRGINKTHLGEYLSTPEEGENETRLERIMSWVASTPATANTPVVLNQVQNSK